MTPRMFSVTLQMGATASGPRPVLRIRWGWIASGTIGAKTRVWPSGALAISARMPTTPEPPSRLVTSTVWPNVAVKLSARARATASVWLPVAYGLMMVIGRSGKARAIQGSNSRTVSRRSISVPSLRLHAKVMQHLGKAGRKLGQQPGLRGPAAEIHHHVIGPRHPAEHRIVNGHAASRLQQVQHWGG